MVTAWQKREERKVRFIILFDWQFFFNGKKLLYLNEIKKKKYEIEKILVDGCPSHQQGYLEILNRMTKNYICDWYRCPQNHTSTLITLGMFTPTIYWAHFHHLFMFFHCFWKTKRDCNGCRKMARVEHSIYNNVRQDEWNSLRIDFILQIFVACSLPFYSFFICIKYIILIMRACLFRFSDFRCEPLCSSIPARVDWERNDKKRQKKNKIRIESLLQSHWTSYTYPIGSWLFHSLSLSLSLYLSLSVSLANLYYRTTAVCYMCFWPFQ